MIQEENISYDELTYKNKAAEIMQNILSTLCSALKIGSSLKSNHQTELTLTQISDKHGWYNSNSLE